jgi:hypothetical protein
MYEIFDYPKLASDNRIFPDSDEICKFTARFQEKNEH